MDIIKQKSINCCVPSCLHVEKRLYQFPNPIDKKLQFDIWLRNINNPELFKLPKEVVYSNYRVCRMHFDRSYYHGTNLRKTAVPTKLLSGFPIKQASTKKVDITSKESKKPEAKTNVIDLTGSSSPAIDPKIVSANDLATSNDSPFKRMVMSKLKVMKEDQRLHAENVINQILYLASLGDLSEECTVVTNSEDTSTVQQIPIEGNVLILKKTANFWTMLKCHTKKPGPAMDTQNKV